MTKFDLVIKWVKANAGSFEQIMMGLSPQCYIPSSKAIGLLVPEKKIFEGYLPNMVMATKLIRINFHSFPP